MSILHCINESGTMATAAEPPPLAETPYVWVFAAGDVYGCNVYTVRGGPPVAKVIGTTPSRAMTKALGIAGFANRDPSTVGVSFGMFFWEPSDGKELVIRNLLWHLEDGTEYRATMTMDTMELLGHHWPEFAIIRKSIAADKIDESSQERWVPFLSLHQYEQGKYEISSNQTLPSANTTSRSMAKAVADFMKKNAMTLESFDRVTMRYGYMIVATSIHVPLTDEWMYDVLEDSARRDVDVFYTARVLDMARVLCKIAGFEPFSDPRESVTAKRMFMTQILKNYTNTVSSWRPSSAFAMCRNLQRIRYTWPELQTVVNSYKNITESADRHETKQIQCSFFVVAKSAGGFAVTLRRVTPPSDDAIIATASDTTAVGAAFAAVVKFGKVWHHAPDLTHLNTHMAIDTPISDDNDEILVSILQDYGNIADDADARSVLGTIQVLRHLGHDRPEFASIERSIEASAVSESATGSGDQASFWMKYSDGAYKCVLSSENTVGVVVAVSADAVSAFDFARKRYLHKYKSEPAVTKMDVMTNVDIRSTDCIKKLLEILLTADNEGMKTVLAYVDVAEHLGYDIPEFGIIRASIESTTGRAVSESASVSDATLVIQVARKAYYTGKQRQDSAVRFEVTSREFPGQIGSGDTVVQALVSFFRETGTNRSLVRSATVITSWPDRNGLRPRSLIDRNTEWSTVVEATLESMQRYDSPSEIIEILDTYREYMRVMGIPGATDPRTDPGLAADVIRELLKRYSDGENVTRDCRRLRSAGCKWPELEVILASARASK